MDDNDSNVVKGIFIGAIVVLVYVVLPLQLEYRGFPKWWPSDGTISFIFAAIAAGYVLLLSLSVFLSSLDQKREVRDSCNQDHEK